MASSLRLGSRASHLLAVAVATLLCGGVAVGQRAQTARAPDAIYHHGKVVTLDGASDIAEAFTVSGDRFVAVGQNASILALADKRTRVVDLGGATVIPGLTDSHDHLWNSAQFEFRGVDMIGVATLSEMQARLRAAVAQAKPGETVFTTLGWRVRPTPTRQDLDAVSAEIPIAVIGSRHASGVVNSAALKRLGISRANPNFKGVKVPVDKDGEPTGVQAGYPASLQLVDALLPQLSQKARDEMIRKAMAERNALGITSTRELALWPAGVAALQSMRREGKLTLRMAIGVEFPEQSETARHLAALPTVRRDDPWLFLDSAGEEPWTPGTLPLDQYSAILREERRRGWRAAPHVSADTARGTSYDDATDQTLAAYEAVSQEGSLIGQRWYLEHVSFATPTEMERMARLGVIVSVQDAGYEPPTTAPLPPERMAHQNPIRGFIDHKIVVIGGSDYTTPTADEREPNNPMIPFYFYVTRKTRSGAILTPSEKISRDEALRIFTVNAAYATFQEKAKGQIAPGMLADFVILNQDLMTVPDEKILATRPLATFVGGRRVYAAPGRSF
jgi:predicted amidohydrolase YtcJ